MMMSTNHRKICFVTNELTAPISAAYRSVDWERYPRSDAICLESGRLIEFPFVRCSTEHWDPLSTTVIKACIPTFELISALYEDQFFIRGELAVLPPLVTLGWHTDTYGVGWHSLCKRLHLPIATNTGCQQLWEDETVHLEQDSLYEINNCVPHSATNQGATHRVHLIIDIMEPRHWPAFCAMCPKSAGRLDSVTLAALYDLHPTEVSGE